MGSKGGLSCLNDQHMVQMCSCRRFRLAYGDDLITNFPLELTTYVSYLRNRFACAFVASRSTENFALHGQWSIHSQQQKQSLLVKTGANANCLKSEKIFELKIV